MLLSGCHPRLRLFKSGHGKRSASQLVQSHGFWADASVPCYEDLSTGLYESTRDPELTSSRGNDSNESKAETTVSFMTSFLVTHHYL